jgi:hypothetical protein
LPRLCAHPSSHCFFTQLVELRDNGVDVYFGESLSRSIRSLAARRFLLVAPALFSDSHGPLVSLFSGKINSGTDKMIQKLAAAYDKDVSCSFAPRLLACVRASPVVQLLASWDSVVQRRSGSALAAAFH